MQMSAHLVEITDDYNAWCFVSAVVVDDQLFVTKLSAVWY